MNLHGEVQGGSLGRPLTVEVRAPNVPIAQLSAGRVRAREWPPDDQQISPQSSEDCVSFEGQLCTARAKDSKGTEWSRRQQTPSGSVQRVRACATHITLHTTLQLFSTSYS